MSSHKTIRVVKREQREFCLDEQDASECGVENEREARRIMFKTIRSWIQEQRELKKQSNVRLALLEEPID